MAEASHSGGDCQSGDAAPPRADEYAVIAPPFHIAFTGAQHARPGSGAAKCLERRYGAQLTATLTATFATTVPEPLSTVQVRPAGCVATVTS